MKARKLLNMVNEERFRYSIRQIFFCSEHVHFITVKQNDEIFYAGHFLKFLVITISIRLICSLHQILGSEVILGQSGKRPPNNDHSFLRVKIGICSS